MPKSPRQFTDIHIKNLHQMLAAFPGGRDLKPLPPPERYPSYTSLGRRLRAAIQYAEGVLSDRPEAMHTVAAEWGVSTQDMMRALDAAQKANK